MRDKKEIGLPPHSINQSTTLSFINLLKILNMKYNLNAVENFVPLTKEEILKIISEEEIMRHYLGFDFVLRKPYSSPLRKDSNPSFALYYNKYSQLRFKDFNGAQGSCFDFVMMKFGLGFFDALIRINRDLHLKLGTYDGLTVVNKAPITYPSFKTTIEKKKNLIQFKPQHFTEMDKKYWSQYGIERTTLVKYNVFSAKYVFYNKKIIFRYSMGNPVYCYKFASDHVKVYRPLHKKSGKWLSNATAEDIQGFSQLDSFEGMLIITKSLKDVMCLYQMGYNSIAPQAEGTYFPEDILIYLQSNFDPIIILYDNDDTGIKGSQILQDRIKCQRIFIEEEKDISDFVKSHNIREGNELIKNKINNYV